MCRGIREVGWSKLWDSVIDLRPRHICKGTAEAEQDAECTWKREQVVLAL